MKWVLRQVLLVVVFFLAVAAYYLYTPPSAKRLHDRISVSLSGEITADRLRLSDELGEYLSRGLPTDAVPSLLRLYLANQRKLTDLRVKQAIEEMEAGVVEPGQARVWSLLNMGVVVKTAGSTLAFDVADMPLSVVQKKLTDLADMFLVTHADLDHYDQLLIRKALKSGKDVVFPEGFLFEPEPADLVRVHWLADGQTLEIGGVSLTAFQTDHRGDGNFQEPNAWYLVKVDGLTFLHTGDGRNFKNPAEKGSLGKEEVDIFLANRQTHPYDIRDIHPQVVVPLHLFQFLHSRETLAQSSFRPVAETYAEHEQELKGIDKIFLFPGEGFVYQQKATPIRNNTVNFHDAPFG